MNNQRAIKVKETPEGNLYKLMPPFPHGKTLGEPARMVEYIVIRTIVEDTYPKSQICISDKDLNEIDPIVTLSRVHPEPEIIKFLRYELLDIKPETTNIFGTMLGEL